MRTIYLVAKKPHKLPNYLRTYRKRAGLTQKEVAHLLGINDPTSVSRHERGVRIPTLERSLEYSVIYQVSLAELFAGILGEEKRGIQVRTKRFLSEASEENRAYEHLQNLFPPEER